MSYVSDALDQSAAFESASSSQLSSLPALMGAFAAAVATCASLYIVGARFTDEPAAPQVFAETTTTTESVNPYGALALDPSAFDPSPTRVGHDWRIALSADFFSPAPVAASAAIDVVAEPSVEPAPAAPALVAPERLAENAPFPRPRPLELQAPASRVASRSVLRQMAARQTAEPAPAQPEDGGFFEKLFGAQKPTSPVLAYAPANEGLPSVISAPAPSPSSVDKYTAVYDISARVVHLPSGERLEAHSGLGDRLDDPRFVHERMRGATPPHVYDLTMRESLFHGVQALRLNPVGGGGVFGRTGLLAHTFMLGPKGDSNGCVSFRNYARFLQAFQNGEIKRLAVVARL